MSYVETLGRQVQMLARGESLDGHVLSPVEQMIGSKALAVAKIIGIDIGVEPVVAPETSEVGIFRVAPMFAGVDWSTPSRDLEISQGTGYLDFHMPPSDDVSREGATEGYRKVARFMDERPGIDLIMGVTYGVMAESAKRNHGFKTEQVDLPTPVMRLANFYWTRIMPKIKPSRFGTAHAVWQTRQDFLDRYLVTTS